MKPLVCIYCEGNDTKLAVVAKEKDNAKIKILRTASVSILPSSTDLEADATGFSVEGDSLDIEGIDETASIEGDLDSSSLSEINEALKDLNLSNYSFVPALTEPAIYYHQFEGQRPPNAGKLKQEIVNEILDTKNINVDKGSLDHIEMADKSLLSVFIVGEVACINLINTIAQQHKKRHFKIPTIKSSDLSLAYYVAKRKKFFPDDNSLVVYIGKEYSKLIFLQGRRLKHIGTTLDIGTQNLHTYDVYFSKILLEMENGGISSLDNIVVCGEDDSENLILSFYGTFPEANVSRLVFDDLDLSELDEETRAEFSAFTIPVSVATDYYDEQQQEHYGINILPKYVKEEQKVVQFGWHSYIMLPLLFLVAFLITQQVLNNNKKIKELNDDITQKTILMRQNQEVLGKIAGIEGKISSFDQTQAILDSATAGTGVWKEVIRDISNFCGQKKSLWISRITRGEGDGVIAEGYSLQRNVLTDFAYSIESATLKSMFYEMLRERSAYKFNLNFNLSSYPKKNE
jgi:hypothetical protein